MGGNDTFDRGACKYTEGNFSSGGNENFLGDGWDSPPISRVSYKGLGERGAVHSCWGQQINIKEGDIFG